MWKCEKCSKEFIKKPSNHFCVKANSVAEYIALQDENLREKLHQIREVILSVSPSVTEKISWHMPTFTLGKNQIGFAVHKNHVGLMMFGYMTDLPQIENLYNYKKSKGAIHLPHDKPLDCDFVKKIATWRLFKNYDQKSSI